MQRKAEPRYPQVADRVEDRLLFNDIGYIWGIVHDTKDQLVYVEVRFKSSGKIERFEYDQFFAGDAIHGRWKAIGRKWVLTDYSYKKDDPSMTKMKAFFASFEDKE